jgi:tryptophanyl-tRNA synthetase
VTKKKRAFSGIQPTGKIHLGNYLGAVKNWVALQETYDCTFCVVDYHAITIDYDPKEMPLRVFDLAVALLACGVDPERCTLFVQSDVPEHVELAWFLASVAPVSRLELQTQYKDKAAQNVENINCGLLTYPVLQAADILVHKADVVPVGDDQAQHLELCREIARKFNNRFGRVFVEPETVLAPAPRVLGLDGKAKMSKSKANTLDLLDDSDALWAKLRGAVTDEMRLRRADPGRPEVCNVFSWHGFLSSPETVARVEGECRTAAIGCVDCKKLLLESLNAELGPIRERAKALHAAPEKVRAILAEGARKARAVAKSTIAEARERMGLPKPAP